MDSQEWLARNESDMIGQYRGKTVPNQEKASYANFLIGLAKLVD